MDKNIQRAKKGLSQQERIEFMHYIDRIAGPISPKNYQKAEHNIFVEKELIRLEVQKRFSYAAAYTFSSVTVAIIGYMYLSLPSYTVITGLASISLSLYLQFYPMRQGYSSIEKMMGLEILEKEEKKKSIEKFWAGAAILFMLPLILPTAFIVQAISLLVNTASIAFYGLRKHIENKIEQQVVLPEKAASAVIQKGYSLFEHFIIAQDQKNARDVFGSYTPEEHLSIDIVSLHAFDLLNKDGDGYLRLLKDLIQKDIDGLTVNQQIDYFILQLKQNPDDLTLHHQFKMLLTLKSFFPVMCAAQSANMIFNRMFQAVIQLTHNPQALLCQMPKEGWDLRLKTYTSLSIPSGFKGFEASTERAVHSSKSSDRSEKPRRKK